MHLKKKDLKKNNANIWKSSKSYSYWYSTGAKVRKKQFSFRLILFCVLQGVGRGGGKEMFMSLFFLLQQRPAQPAVHSTKYYYTDLRHPFPTLLPIVVHGEDVEHVHDVGGWKEDAGEGI
jgi:hypothetical protein